MEISELRQKPHLSASSINDYMDCSLLFKFGRVLKLKPEIRPDALEFGSIIHRQRNQSSGNENGQRKTRMVRFALPP